MTPELIAELNDLRKRVLEMNQLLAAGEPLPAGLAPTAEEMREALTKLRESRTGALVDKETKAKTAKAPAANLPADLMDLFKS